MFQNALISFDFVETAAADAETVRGGGGPAGGDIFPHAAGVRWYKD